jgi:hypothetical protein
MDDDDADGGDATDSLGERKLGMTRRRRGGRLGRRSVGRIGLRGY